MFCGVVTILYDQATIRTEFMGRMDDPVAADELLCPCAAHDIVPVEGVLLNPADMSIG